MKHINLRSPAKINLCLDILGKDERSEMHFVNTLIYMHPSLSDEIILTKTRSAYNVLKCDVDAVPVDESNTILHALSLLGENGWNITLKKNIPLQTGLGGGSGNAGVVLKAFADIKGIPLPYLESLASQIGTDVPCFLADNNLVYCDGFGEQVVQSWDIPKLDLVLLETDVNVSTKSAYRDLDFENCGQQTHMTDVLLKSLNEGWRPSSLEDIKPFIHNDFETSFFAKNPSWDGKGNLCGSGGWMWCLDS